MGLVLILRHYCCLFSELHYNFDLVVIGTGLSAIVFVSLHFEFGALPS